MAGLCWMAVMLAFFLSAENSLATVDQNRLTTVDQNRLTTVNQNRLTTVDQNRLAMIVNGILREYGVPGMFSLAVSIPDNQNQNLNQILQQVFNSDPGNNVRNKINNDMVYVGNRVVAAKVLRWPTGGADHAESRVVDHLDDLFNPHTKNDLLLFYVYASPCVEKCTSATHPERILQRINPIRQWPNYAFVFSKIFRPNIGSGNTDQERTGALQRLGTAVGLENIFRCDRTNNWMQCTSCSINGGVAHYCVSDSPASSNLPPTSG